MANKKLPDTLADYFFGALIRDGERREQIERERAEQRLEEATRSLAVTVIGRKQEVNRDDPPVLNLVQISYRSYKAYALLDDDDMDTAFPNCEVGPTNVFDESERHHKIRPGLKPLRCIAAASYSPYGCFVPPPEWDLLKDTDVPKSFRLPIYFDAEVLVHWDDGVQSWAKGGKLLSSSLADAGRANEKSFRLICQNYYLDHQETSNPGNNMYDGKRGKIMKHSKHSH